MSTRHETNHDIHVAKLVQMPWEKKEEVVSVFVCNGKADLEAEKIV